MHVQDTRSHGRQVFSESCCARPIPRHQIRPGYGLIWAHADPLTIRLVIPEGETGKMATPATPAGGMIHCNDCDVTFAASNASAQQAHQGHDLEHVEPGG